MANAEQLQILKQGVEVWNAWRMQNPSAEINLTGATLPQDLSNGKFQRANFERAVFFRANLQGSDFSEAYLWNADLREANITNTDFRDANLFGANLKNARLSNSNLTNANLRSCNLEGTSFFKTSLNNTKFADASLKQANLDGADLSGNDLHSVNLLRASLIAANLSGANMSQSSVVGAILSRANLCYTNLTSTDLSESHLDSANLKSANLFRADLYKTDLSHADLTGANLQNAVLVETNLNNTIFTNCKVYGISAWKLKGILKDQSSLIITPDTETEISVDSLEVAQFIFLLTRNKTIRNIIDTITSKVVLILGRFADKRKSVLEAIRDELRKMNLTPVLFDFDKPASKDITGTVETLARMAKFVIADLTGPNSVPHELAYIIKDLRTTPVITVIQKGYQPYPLFADLQRDLQHRVLPTHEYLDGPSLIAELSEVIKPANDMAEAFRSGG